MEKVSKFFISFGSLCTLGAPQSSSYAEKYSKFQGHEKNRHTSPEKWWKFHRQAIYEYISSRSTKVGNIYYEPSGVKSFVTVSQKLLKLSSRAGYRKYFLQNINPLPPNDESYFQRAFKRKWQICEQRFHFLANSVKLITLSVFEEIGCAKIINVRYVFWEFAGIAANFSIRLSRMKANS